MKHTITITLDVPEGMESAVHDKAYSAIELLNADCQRRMDNAHEAARLLRHANATADTSTLVDVQVIVDNLNKEARRIHHSTQVVKSALSEIMHVMAIADNRRRVESRREPITQPETQHAAT